MPIHPPTQTLELGVGDRRKPWHLTTRVRPSGRAGLLSRPSLRLAAAGPVREFQPSRDQPAGRSRRGSPWPYGIPASTCSAAVSSRPRISQQSLRLVASTAAPASLARPARHEATTGVDPMRLPSGDAASSEDPYPPEPPYPP